MQTTLRPSPQYGRITRIRQRKTRRVARRPVAAHSTSGIRPGHAVAFFLARPTQHMPTSARWSDWLGGAALVLGVATWSVVAIFIAG